MRILVLPGDGTGPGIAAAAVAVLEPADRLCKLGLEHDVSGFESLRRDGWTLRGDRFHACDGVVLGPNDRAAHLPPKQGGINHSGMPLDWLGARHGGGALARAGQAIRAAVERVLADPGGRTADLGGTCGRRAFGQAVAAALG